MRITKHNDMIEKGVLSQHFALSISINRRLNEDPEFWWFENYVDAFEFCHLDIFTICKMWDAPSSCRFSLEIQVLSLEKVNAGILLIRGSESELT